MRKKRTNTWTALLCLIAVLFTGTPAVPGKAYAQSPSQGENAAAIEKAAGWLLEQKQENGGFGDLRCGRCSGAGRKSGRDGVDASLQNGRLADWSKNNNA